ncbi:hypothetical protein OCU04_003930 [Sclerotinia nivalis]|uniref:Uncharacterized protein n=1 Tax=Sclerotinia nivalis TaxID=352851 RepID=A0A9X0AWE2_9HELO|nr:hypothetical protein OCU04_003930 [Sclerotinia nivalis]
MFFHFQVGQRIFNVVITTFYRHDFAFRYGIGNCYRCLVRMGSGLMIRQSYCGIPNLVIQRESFERGAGGGRYVSRRIECCVMQESLQIPNIEASTTGDPAATSPAFEAWWQLARW